MNDWMRDEKVKEILLDKQSIEKFLTKPNQNLYLKKILKMILILPEKKYG